MTDNEEKTTRRSDIIGIILCIAALLSLWYFVDWGVDRADERLKHHENCIEAERALGDDIYRERPDCRKTLEGGW